MPSNEALLDIHQLPEQLGEFITDWNVVYLPDQTKTMLLDYVHTLTRLRHANAIGLALRRAVLLYGPPGCGKTSLARGLPAMWLKTATHEPKAGFIQVNTHALFSGERGGGQQRILKAFQQIAEQATNGVPIFVLIDEIETLGTDRTSISFEANPLDALYQVTAFFESFDKLTRTFPNLVFIFTTNIPKALDRAVRERVDFSVEIPLPDVTARSMILTDAVRSLSGAFDVTELTHIALSSPPDPRWMSVIDQAEGLSGRALRHVLVLAATYAVRSQGLGLAHLQQAISQVLLVEQRLRDQGGVYLESYQAPQNTGPSDLKAIEPSPAPPVANGDAVYLGEKIARLREEVLRMQEMLQFGLTGQETNVPVEATINDSPKISIVGNVHGSMP